MIKTTLALVIVVVSYSIIDLSTAKNVYCDSKYSDCLKGCAYDDNDCNFRCVRWKKSCEETCENGSDQENFDPNAIIIDPKKKKDYCDSKYGDCYKGCSCTSECSSKCGGDFDFDECYDGCPTWAGSDAKYDCGYVCFAARHCDNCDWCYKPKCTKWCKDWRESCTNACETGFEKEIHQSVSEVRDVETQKELNIDDYEKIVEALLSVGVTIEKVEKILMNLDD